MKGGTELTMMTEPFIDPNYINSCVISFVEYQHNNASIFLSNSSPPRSIKIQGNMSLSSTGSSTIIKLLSPPWPEDWLRGTCNFVETQVLVSLNGQDFGETPIGRALIDPIFTYHQNISLHSITPSSGSITGGTKIKISTNFKLDSAWTPRIQFRSKRDLVVRGEIIGGEIHCLTPACPSKTGKSGGEDVQICVSLNGVDFSGDEDETQRQNSHCYLNASAIGDERA